MPIKTPSYKMSHLIKNSTAISAGVRHSFKYEGRRKRKTGLTIKGIQKARQSAKLLPADFTLVASHGNEPRHKATARYALEAYKQGSRSKTLREAEVLGTKWFTDLKGTLALANELGKLERESGKGAELLKELKNESKVVKELGLRKLYNEWIDGNIPTSLIAPPEKVGKAIIIDMINQTELLRESTPNRPFHLNVLSAPFEMAILKTLGIDYRKIKPKTRSKTLKQGDYLQPTEGMLFFHMPSGEIILRYRGRPINVTQQIKRLLS